MFAGAAAIYGAKALKKGKENGEKADIAAIKTDEIHAVASDNLPGLTKTVEQHGEMLKKLDNDLQKTNGIVTVVRERQHDLNSYLTQIGLAFELKKIPGSEEPRPQHGD